MMDSPDVMEQLNACPPALRAVIEEFRAVEPRERLDLLVDFALELPDLPTRLQPLHDEMEQVHECMTPVFLHTELDGGGAHFHFDIPREAPTVRGYAGALLEGLDGATPAEIIGTPDNVYMLMKLQESLTPQRLRGIHALLGYMKRQVKKLG